jgi:hypothetical protein
MLHNYRVHAPIGSSSCGDAACAAAAAGADALGPGPGSANLAVPKRAGVPGAATVSAVISSFASPPLASVDSAAATSVAAAADVPAAGGCVGPPFATFCVNPDRASCLLRLSQLLLRLLSIRLRKLSANSCARCSSAAL